jgi:hypothetical protein
MVLLEVYCTYEGEEKLILNFGGKPEAQGPLGRLLCKWDKNTKMGIKQIGWREGHKMD